MNAVESAIYAKLAGDAAVMLKVNGVFFRKRTDPAAGEPYVIFSEEAGNDYRSFGGRIATGALYLVKVVDKGDSAQRADAAYEVVDAALEDQPLTITGRREVYRMARETTVSYDEDDPAGDTYWHVGGVYRLVTSPS